jgi:hypothetical protein
MRMIASAQLQPNLEGCRIEWKIPRTTYGVNRDSLFSFPYVTEVSVEDIFSLTGLDSSESMVHGRGLK